MDWTYSCVFSNNPYSTAQIGITQEVLGQLSHLPITGEHFELDGYRFEVVDMDGLRIDKVLINNLPATQIPPAAAMSTPEVFRHSLLPLSKAKTT